MRIQFSPSMYFSSSIYCHLLPGFFPLPRIFLTRTIISFFLAARRRPRQGTVPRQGPRQGTPRQGTVLCLKGKTQNRPLSWLLSYKVCSNSFLFFRQSKFLLAKFNAFHKEYHVSCQSSHGLSSFLILEGFTGQEPMD